MTDYEVFPVMKYSQLNKKADTIILKVKEALPKDVGRAIARIDPEDMKKIEAEVGETIEIIGKRITPAKVMPCYAEDRGKNIIQIDGITRENAQVGIDEKIKIQKVKAKPASKITLAPLRVLGLMNKDKDIKYIGSLIGGLPLTAGDRISSQSFWCESLLILKY